MRIEDRIEDRRCEERELNGDRIEQEVNEDRRCE